MNKRSCAACSLSDSCTELLDVVDKNPENITLHRCKEFCGISSGELEVRTKLLNTFGVSALASTITQPKEVHVAYSVAELKQLPRSPLRNIAEKLGMSPAKSSEMPIEELREYILNKQPSTKGKAKGTKKPAKKAAPAAEPEIEDENQEPEAEAEERSRPGRVDYGGEDGEDPVANEEKESSEEDEDESPVEQGDLEAKVSKLQATVVALGDMMGEFVDIHKKHRKFDRRAFATLDRKINCLLGSLDMIGAKVVGDDFDPMKCEESHSKKFQHTVPFSMIQKAVGDPVEEEDD